MILRTLGNKHSPPAIPRNMAQWYDVPVEEVRRELEQLRQEGIAEQLTARPGRERVWVLTEDRA